MNLNNKIVEIINLIKPNPLLLIETRYSNVNKIIFDYIKNINCSFKPFCNECSDCKRINNLSYYDLKIIDGINNSIHKEDVLEIVKSFEWTALEKKGNKFLIIYGIENANKFVVNLLLKTIENPYNNTYFIFTCRNEQQVISTIKSRCQTYKILGNKNECKENLLSLTTLENAETLLSMYYSECEMIDNFKNNEYLQIYELASKIKKSLRNYSELKTIMNNFKTLGYSQIEALINYLCNSLEQIHKGKVIELLSYVKFKLNKILIFNYLIDILS